ncbi:Unsaturated rhamnogalacturonyl hydrolase [Ascochyta rabiei]|uniref:Unsaturated rhamnogalacturonyl hydrolase n=1 Tax=Didymella rabiei TaxID=5454 RepID=UPI001900471E|nr:Unsaturated rhamnogalacturonyl hydrolase [Ascochyta rabiei]UPX11410.1 Unsaturated rhamnogalacturonyl hydrolase [Ascochyta rabiei]
MLESIISRGEGIRAADGLLSGIQKGIFQEALRAAVEWSSDEQQNKKWLEYHRKSVKYNSAEFLDPILDSLAPLDRLCAGRSLMRSRANEQDQEGRAVLIALRKSIDLQLRNSDGGYWYFVDPPPPYKQYGNLSYSDGMYGFAPFAVLYGLIYGDPHLNIDSALQQLEIMYKRTLQKDTGLIVHGYDGSRQAPWANPKTGASPIVWGRSLAWYTIGLVDALAMAETDPGLRQTKAYSRMREIYENLASAEIEAIKRSAKTTGRYGVWQVFDQPGKEGNFVEASATAMLVYALGKGLRYGYVRSEKKSAWVYILQRPKKVLMEDVKDLLHSTYNDLLENFVMAGENGTLDFEGTSVLSSLHVTNPNFDYYVNREVSKNSLIGTSAFVLASLEIEHLEDNNL